jgi:nucleotide-binding universal stress UspA family protein
MSLVAAVDDSSEASTVLAKATRLATDLDEQLHTIHVLKRSELGTLTAGGATWT